MYLMPGRQLVKQVEECRDIQHGTAQFQPAQIRESLTELG